MFRRPPPTSVNPQGQRTPRCTPGRPYQVVDGHPQLLAHARLHAHGGLRNQSRQIPRGVNVEEGNLLPQQAVQHLLPHTADLRTRVCVV